MTKIKVIIADDNSFIRKGLKIILNTYEEFDVLDTVNDGQEALEFCKAFSNSRSAAGALQNLIVMPTVMLSGCFWPVEVMPTSVQKIADFLPQRWTLDTLTKLQDGNSFGSLYLNIMILFAFAIAFFLIPIYKFSRNNNTRNFV